MRERGRKEERGGEGKEEMGKEGKEDSGEGGKGVPGYPLFFFCHDTPGGRHTWR